FISFFLSSFCIYPYCHLPLHDALPISSCTTGPHVSASRGTERNCSTSPLRSPSSCTRKSPSLYPIVPGAPSVEIHRWPARSKARLSGHEIGETSSRV